MVQLQLQSQKGALQPANLSARFASTANLFAEVEGDPQAFHSKGEDEVRLPFSSLTPYLDLSIIRGNRLDGKKGSVHYVKVELIGSEKGISEVWGNHKTVKTLPKKGIVSMFNVKKNTMSFTRKLIEEHDHEPRQKRAHGFEEDDEGHFKSGPEPEHVVAHSVRITLYKRIGEESLAANESGLIGSQTVDLDGDLDGMCTNLKLRFGGSTGMFTSQDQNKLTIRVKWVSPETAALFKQEFHKHTSKTRPQWQIPSSISSAKAAGKIVTRERTVDSVLDTDHLPIVPLVSFTEPPKPVPRCRQRFAVDLGDIIAQQGPIKKGDWIGLYNPGDKNESVAGRGWWMEVAPWMQKVGYLVWNPEFTPPNSGTYELRYFRNRNYRSPIKSEPIKFIRDQKQKFQEHTSSLHRLSQRLRLSSEHHEHDGFKRGKDARGGVLPTRIVDMIHFYHDRVDDDEERMLKEEQARKKLADDLKEMSMSMPSPVGSGHVQGRRRRSSMFDGIRGVFKSNKARKRAARAAALERQHEQQKLLDEEDGISQEIEYKVGQYWVKSRSIVQQGTQLCRLENVRQFFRQRLDYEDVGINDEQDRRQVQLLQKDSPLYIDIRPFRSHYRGNAWIGIHEVEPKEAPSRDLATEPVILGTDIPNLSTLRWEDMCRGVAFWPTARLPWNMLEYEEEMSKKRQETKVRAVHDEQMDRNRKLNKATKEAIAKRYELRFYTHVKNKGDKSEGDGFRLMERSSSVIEVLKPKHSKKDPCVLATACFDRDMRGSDRGFWTQSDLALYLPMVFEPTLLPDFQRDFRAWQEKARRQDEQSSPRLGKLFGRGNRGLAVPWAAFKEGMRRAMHERAGGDEVRLAEIDSIVSKRIMFRFNVHHWHGKDTIDLYDQNKDGELNEKELTCALIDHQQHSKRFFRSAMHFMQWRYALLLWDRIKYPGHKVVEDWLRSAVRCLRGDPSMLTYSMMDAILLSRPKNGMYYGFSAEAKEQGQISPQLRNRHNGSSSFDGDLATRYTFDPIKTKLGPNKESEAAQNLAPLYVCHQEILYTLWPVLTEAVLKRFLENYTGRQTHIGQMKTWMIPSRQGTKLLDFIVNTVLDYACVVGEEAKQKTEAYEHDEKHEESAGGAAKDQNKKPDNTIGTPSAGSPPGSPSLQFTNLSEDSFDTV